MELMHYYVFGLIWDYLEDALMNLGFHNHVCNNAIGSGRRIPKTKWLFYLADEGWADGKDIFTATVSRTPDPRSRGENQDVEVGR